MLSALKGRISEAGGQLLAAAFNFLGQIVPAPAATAALRENLLQCVGQTEDGRPTLTVTLPDTAALPALAETLARLIQGAAPPSST